MTVAKELNIEHEVILYIKTPPGEEELRTLVSALQDPVEDLVRKDAKFKKLGLNPAHFVNKPEAVIQILLKHKQLLQRPILLHNNKAIIGRPKSKIFEFLNELSS